MSEFDPDFYVKNNFDVAKAGIDPALHYQIFGSKEGRAGSAADAANGGWTLNGRYAEAEGANKPAAPVDPANTKFAGNPYGFDSAFYLKNNPDVAATGVDPLQHFLSYGINENRARNDTQAAGGVPATNIPAGIMAPPPEAAPALDPTDPASWTAFRKQASAQTQGINRLPRTAPGTDTLSADPLAVLSQFYPKSNNYGYLAPGQEQMAAMVSNLGMGRR